MVDTPLLKKIKMIQANELKQWKGLPLDYLAKPGQTLNAQPSKRLNKNLEYFKVSIITHIHGMEWAEWHGQAD